MSESIATAQTIHPGDIVASDRFTFGRCEHEDWSSAKPDWDGRLHDWRPILVGLHEPYEVDETVQLDVDLGGVMSVELAKLPPLLFDRSNDYRAFCSYVVLQVEQEWRERRRGDDYDVDRTGLHLIARRLTEHGDYDPEGELIQFWMTGPFDDLITEVSLTTHVDLAPFIEQCPYHNLLSVRERDED